MDEGNINRIMNAYKNAQEAANYAEALVLDDELISGADYRMIWTNSYNGDFPPLK